jgi:hypothetical protein
VVCHERVRGMWRKRANRVTGWRESGGLWLVFVVSKDAGAGTERSCELFP